MDMRIVLKIQQLLALSSSIFRAKMYKSQNGLCLICKIDLTHRKVNIDHCHKTGKVRGLLCVNCNLGIGNLREDPCILYSAFRYLNDFRD